MRTTIALSDALLAKAKRRAEDENLTLGELIEIALKAHLTRPRAPAAVVPFRLVTFGKGGLAPGLSYERLKEVVAEEEAGRLDLGRGARAADAPMEAEDDAPPRR